MQYARRQFFLLRQSLETFRFGDENDYEYDIWLKAFSRILKIDTPELRFDCAFDSPEKVEGS